jgi:hypothetical protein
MSDYDKMKVSEMRKMLKEHRKTSIVPVSKMSKIALMKELDKFAGTPSTQPSHAPVEKARTEVSKHQAMVEEGKGVPKKTKKALKGEEKVVVPTGVQGVGMHAPKKVVKSEAVQEKPVAMGRLIKGSQEARDFMQSIRMKKTKKDNVD